MKNQFTLLVPALLALMTLQVHAQVGIGTTSPNSMLDLRGSFAPIYRSFTAATSLTTNDFTVVFTGGTAATATLPDATTCPGRIYCIKNFSTTLPAPVLTIGTVSSQQIDGLTTWLLNQTNQSVTITSDGTNWEVTGQSSLAATGSSWNLGGNSVTGTQNLGTTSAYDLPFITNNTEKMRITSAGNVGIGITNPTYKLQVSATANPLFLSGLQTGLSTDSILTVVNGVVRKLQPGALVTSSSNAWSLIGNSGTNPSTNFIGTADAQAFILKENNLQVGRFEQNSIALGFGATTANSPNSYALGSGANIGFNKLNAFAIGTNAYTSNDSSFALGNASATSGQNAFSIGTGSQANSINSLAIGRNAYVGYSTSDALAIGTNATTSAANAISIGSNITAANKTQATAASSIAIGNTTIANSPNAIAIGTGATTGYSLTGPVAIGNGAIVNGSNGVAVGNGANISFVSNATALGAGASVTSTGNNSTAIGYNAAATLANELILGDRSNGNLSVGIGTETFSGTNREKLLVDLGTTSSVNAIVGRGTNPSYLQLNIQNLSNGTGASSDVVATADNGNETINYVDLGINSSTNTSNVMGAANDAYLYTTGNNFLLGTGTAAKALVFMTGGTTQSTNERMRIDGSGKVGIGTNAPANTLQVVGTNPLSLLGVQTGTNTSADSLLTITNGLVRKLSLSTFATSTSNWNITGNAGTNSGTNFLGTTDNTSLTFRTNNASHAILDSTGNMGIGTGVTFNAAAPEKLLVNAGTTTSYNAVVAKGSVNNYFQLNINNQSNGTSASSDVVATADNGNEVSNFVDLGINSSTNTANIMGAANDAYLYTTGNNFLLGTGTAAKALVFMTGGTTQSTNERMRIDGNGKVGIGTSTPASDLTLFQSTSTTSEGFRFTGNSIGGTNTGSGFAMALGYNVPNNKQLWLGDADYLGNSTGTFVRYSTSSGQTILDAIAGDNGARRPIAIGVGGDPSSAVILGGDGSSTAPGSYVWANGNMAIGNSYRAGSAPANGLIVQGNVGIGTNAPATALAVAGTNPLTLLGVQTGTNTNADSVLTITSGLVRKLPLSTFSTTTGNWSTTGNAGTSSGTDFLGTTDNTSLTFRTNNIPHAILDSTGNMGIGNGVTFNAAAPEKLLVNAGTTTSYNAVVAKGSVNNYFQLNINNQNAGTNASSDVVATADNGNETTNFVDLGINSSTNSANIMGAANDAYLYTTGNNFLLGTGTAAKALVFMTGGTTQSTNERMRIDGSGNVGIGTNNPGNKLEVNSGTGGVSGLRLKQLPVGGVLFMSATADVSQNNNNFYFDATNYRLSIAAGTTPASTLQVGGSLATAITTKNANYTASVNDHTILCNNIFGGITISLPTAAGITGRIYVIKKISAAGSTVTIAGYSGVETVDGNVSTSLASQYSSLMIQSDGTNWYILSKN